MSKKPTPRVLPAIPQERKVVTETTSADGRKNDKVSVREWLDADGAVTNDETKASGFRLRMTETGDAITHDFGEPGSVRTMCAIFGALTKLGNEVNTHKAKTGTPSLDPARAFWDHLVSTGEWGVPGLGGGPRVNFERLREAVRLRGEELGKDASASIAKLGEPGEEDAEYAKVLLNNLGIKAVYDRLAGKAIVEDDAVFG